MAFNTTQILILTDKNGKTIRQCTFSGNRSKERMMNEWKRLYGNNRAFQESTFSVEENDYANYKKPRK